MSDYLKKIAAMREAEESRPAPGVPCERCHGTGRQPTALEQFSALSWTLTALMWSPERIALLRDELHADEVVVAARWGGLDLRTPDGSTRTLPRQHG